MKMKQEIKEKRLIEKVKKEFSLNLENQFPQGVDDIYRAGYEYEENDFKYVVFGILIPKDFLKMLKWKNEEY